MISFLAGKPNPSTFPFSSISVTLKPVADEEPETLTVETDALNEALQYGPTAGLGGLVNWIEDMEEKVHSRPRDGSWRVSLGSGSQDLINKAFQSLVNDGDSILLETPVYSGTLGLLAPEAAKLVEVSTDTSGLIPEALEELLATWSEKRPNDRFPKLLYTIPTGANPTGCSTPLDRKVKILAIARKYNLLILEDDAYYFLHFDKPNQAPSYFELEARDGATTGRVVRFDSFSKILSSGMRLGFMSAPKPIVDIVDLHTANTNLQPNSTTQAIVLALLSKWGYEGFIQHTARVAAFYKAKRDMFESYAHKHLDGLASWVSPDSGMFLFLKLNLPAPYDSEKLIGTAAMEKGFLAVPGVSFMPSKSTSAYVRASFSLATEDDADVGFSRLRENGIKTLLQYHPWNECKTHERILEELGGDITCIQETKITRERLDKSMAVMSNYDCFYSFFRSKPARGIHGTAIFSKRDVAVPVKAEEGLGASLLPTALPLEERIGGYPNSWDLDITEEEMNVLDREGRTTVCDFGMFVLINLYCPNETNEDRLVFKNNFNDMVDRRVRALIKAGREVIVVGDLNICTTKLDSAEAAESTIPRAPGVPEWADHRPRKWLRDFVGPDGPMIDITRKYHPHRKGMYTCWNTKIDARPSNYGTRLDYILITPALLPWVRDSNILPNIVGSDHCPVFVDFHDEIEIEGRGKVSLWSEMNRGTRDDPRPEPPAFAAKFYDEFSGKQQLLSSFFSKRDPNAPLPVASTSKLPVQPSASAPVVSSNGTALAVTSKAVSSSQPVRSASSSNATSGLSSTAKGKRKQVEEEAKPAKSGQQSISSFFKPPPKPEPVPKKKKKKVSKPDGTIDRASSASSTASGSNTPLLALPPADLTNDEDGPPEDFDWRDESGMAAASASSAAAWSKLFTPKPLPLCDGHKEPTKLWTVQKPGLNKGRRFYLCARPVGPAYDQGQAKIHVNPEYRCNFFEWETNVTRPVTASTKK
ncbi:AP endonuclease 2 [Pseudohyphozyma bogoriensis]|nr:AP endonuclease 2 [Pseudohyphozyma bogoriensis]